MSVELHLWVMPAAGRSPRPVLEKVLRPYLRDHPGTSVRIWVVPWGTSWDRLMSVLKGRQGAFAPDVLQIDGAWTGTLARLGLLKELTPRLWELEGEGFFQALWEACYLPPTRRIFAVPWTMDLRVLHADGDALRRAGIHPGSPPGPGWGELESLMSAAPRLRGLRPFPAWDGGSLLASFAPWAWSAGASFPSPEGGGSLLSPESLKAASFFRTFLAQGAAAGLRFAPLGAPRDRSVALLPPLRGPAARFAYLGGSVLALSSGTRHPGESWSLLQHLVSTDVRRECAGAAGLLPPKLSEAQSGLEEKDRGSLEESLSCARILTPSVFLGSFERLFQRHLSDVVLRSAPWEEWRSALARADREAVTLFSHHEPAEI